ncbi:SAM-dependent methyltransferase [Sphaerisporangium corydalis]|uniref:SAM-dependent methyltransferase n=1 Tax=Sphaerisporangium corydalis TaxID=1441875 RepID=A0ABV9EA71_9ACTN|nr:SAM-dependent methyltransferase [Sphaerisporangium corydalis]
MANTLGDGSPGPDGGPVPLHSSLDTGRPRVARIYNCLLGDERDSFASEREAAAKIMAVNPGVQEMVRANRRFLGRAVQYAVADAGIRQILDIGSGYPTQLNVHQVAQSCAPSVRTVYVDNDDIVANHGRALLANNENTFFIEADLRTPGAILGACESLLDLAEPVALFLLAILHFIPPEEDPYRIVKDLVGELAPGSLLVVSHVLDVPNMRASARVYKTANAPGVVRTEEEILGFFDGLEMVEPGLVRLPEWRPDETNVDDILDAQAERMPVAGGMGRKTH